VILKDWTWIVAIALAASLAACGDDSAGDDDGAGSPDAGPIGDGSVTDPTGDVAGGWTFSAARVDEEQPFLRCSVMIADGVFDVTCPQGQVPRPAGEGCQQLRDDLHVHGNVVAALVGHLDGMFDTIVEYEGSSCVTYGLTVGAPFPLPAFAQLDAERVEAGELGDFLRLLTGRWSFTLEDTRDTDAGLACEVDIGLARGRTGRLGVDVAIACPAEDVTEVQPDCFAQASVALDLHAAPGELDGTIVDETRHQGDGCDEEHPPLVSEPRATVTARRAAP
jgi:hypothetical protein